LLVAEAHRIGPIGPEWWDPVKPATFVQGDCLALMDPRLETDHGEAVPASGLDQGVQHPPADPPSTEGRPNGHALPLVRPLAHQQDATGAGCASVVARHEEPDAVTG